MENKPQDTSVTPKDLTFKLLDGITNHFSDEHQVGSGGYGVVYKGLLESGEEIAIKKLHQMVGLDNREFENEFSNLMRAQHKHIVRLVGYCYEIQHKHVEHNGQFHFGRVQERLLCFEYLQGGGLDKHLSDESCGLDWNTRYKIIKGICEGLHYLHTGYKDKIYHLDLKPANILLDKNMTPKIGDFGLSRLFASSQTYTTKKFVGTPGYMPPEYIQKRQISPKFDVFSLGVIIIQIMTGPLGYSKYADTPSQETIKIVHGNWEKRLQTMSLQTSQEVKACIEIALRCVEVDRSKRPTTAEIIDELNKLDTAARRSQLISQSSESNGCAGRVDPMELRFPFELNKEISCVLQLTNRTDDSMAFSTKANKHKYYARPEQGVVPPCSKSYVVVTMRAQEKAPPGMQCNDVFLVQSTAAASTELDDITECFRNMSTMMGNKVVDEERLPVVYVALPAGPQNSTPTSS